MVDVAGAGVGAFGLGAAGEDIEEGGFAAAGGAHEGNQIACSLAFLQIVSGPKMTYPAAHSH